MMNRLLIALIRVFYPRRKFYELVGRHIASIALQHALKEVGHGEETANNEGPDITRYTKQEKPAAWCAGFVCYCLQKASDYLGMEMPIKYSLGAKKTFRQLLKIGVEVTPEQARPGDIFCLERGLDGDWRGHIGIIKGCFESDNRVIYWETVEGNVGKFPAKVKILRRNLLDPETRLVGVVRI